MAATNTQLTCFRCKRPLPWEALNTAGLTVCAACGAHIRAWAFPALLSPSPAGAPAALILDGAEAGCFYHPEKKAVAVCESCGRFLCGLCEVGLAGGTTCAPCLSSGARKGRVTNLSGQRTLHDEVAFALAVYPLLAFPLTLLTAPMALYIAVRHWKTPAGILPRGHARFVAAIILAGMQVGGWIAFFVLSYLRRHA